eukprot:7448488-Alexandrium_andersonii.AAC.1
MSASLVGSEMCIRDSSSSGGSSSSSSSPSPAASHQGARWSRRSSGRAPVSYTHLTLPTICSV